MPITTDIIVVLYGDPGDMHRLIGSIKDHCEESSYNLIIIDNNETNRGFTKAVNEGILSSSSPYIWLLNQDAVVLPGAQDALIRRIESHEKVGIAGSMQLDPEDRDLIRHGGTMRAFPSGVHKGGRVSMGHCRIPEKSIWVNFASVMLRREMVKRIGVLDENMYLVYSDSDYCFWARYRGWEVWYEPESKVLHRLNASKNVSEWHQKDMQAFMDKWGISLEQNGQFTSHRLFQKLNIHP